MTNQPARAFQKGDKLRCVDAGPNVISGKVPPAEGIVLSVNGNNVTLEGDERPWSAPRFVLASPAPEEAGWVLAKGLPAQTFPAGTLCRWGDDIQYKLREPAYFDGRCFAPPAKLRRVTDGWEMEGVLVCAFHLPRTPEPAAKCTWGPCKCGRAGTGGFTLPNGCTGFTCDEHWGLPIEQYDALRPDTQCEQFYQGAIEVAQPSPVKADKRDPYAEHRKAEPAALYNDFKDTADSNEAARLRNIAALRRDLDSSSAKRRAALGRRFDGRLGIDLEQAWSTPGDES